MKRARVCLAVAAAIATFVATSAWASEHPTTRLLSAPQMTPPQGWSELGSATLHTPGATAWTQTPPEIEALAHGLGAGRSDPTAPEFLSADAFIGNAYDYVRHNIRTEFRFGLGKGARGALVDQSGTAFDQAELLVKLLRKRPDVTASYRFGSITLDADQFGRWSGFVRDLSADGSTFRVDAAAACQFLADGGIPATCTADPAGGLTAVTLAHVWVIANGKALDPSVKRHKLRRGLDLATALGCGTTAAPTCGPLLVQTATQNLPPPPSVQGLPAVAGVRHGAIAGELSARAQALEAAIKAQDPAASLEGVIGGIVTDVTEAGTFDAALPYPTTELSLSAAEIPDQFRTRFTLSCGPVTQVLFADELAGRRLFWGALLVADDIELASDACPFDTTYAPDGSISISTTATVAVDHPYPAGGRLYGDETVRLAFAGYGLRTLLLSVGASSPSAESHMADLQVADPRPRGLGYGSSTLGAQILAQQALADRLIEQTGAIAITQHHTLGVISDNGFTTPQPINWISMHSAMSAASRTGDAAARAAGFETSAVVRAMIEGSVAQQQQDAQYAQSGVAELAGSNAHGVTFVRVATSAEMQNLRSSGQLVGYGEARLQRLQALVDAGSELILPLSGENPCADSVGTVCPGGHGALALTSDGRAYLFNEYLKGGSNVAPKDPDTSIMESAKRGDYSLKQASFQTVDAASGALQLKPPPDVTTGTGAFPFSLSIQREYSSAAPAVEEANAFVPICVLCDNSSKHNYRGPDRDVIPRIGGGWTFNLGIGATLGADANRALGGDAGLDASAAIAGLYVLQHTLRDTSLAGRITAVSATHWLGEQFLYNSAVVTIGSGKIAFHRLPSGAFNAPRGAGGRLQQTNHRTPYRSASTYGHHYNDVTLAYTDRDGAVLHFDPANGSGVPGGPPTTAPWFKPTTWTFPSGVKVQFHYNAVQVTPFGGEQPTEVQYVLTRISNSLGRYIDFESQLLGGVPGKASWGAVVTGVTTDGGQTARYALADCPILPPAAGLGTPTGPAKLACNTLRVTLPGADAPQIKYGYLAAPDSPDPLVPTKPAYRLRRWYAPSDPDVPFGVVRYDGLLRVSEVVDALQRRDAYFVGSVSGAEAFKRSEHVDPLRSSTVDVFGRGNELVRRRDVLGHVTKYAYDDARQLRRTEFPEGNAEERSYDLRGNATQVCSIPKARKGFGCNTAAGDIAIQTSYPEPAALTCQDPVRCNRPLAEVDARGGTTSYTWNALGYLERVEAPADTSGVRPRTVYGYTAFASGNATFHLLTSKTSRISASENTTTEYRYDPANRFVLREAVVDVGGLNLTTRFEFNPDGTLRGVDGPRPGAADTATYVWDEQRRLRLMAEADPDGAGPAVRKASRFTYTIDGELATVEQGTSLSGVATADFTPLQRTSFKYDVAGNKTRETVHDGVAETPLSITDFAYDPLDRLWCSATRMELARAGEPGGACEQRGVLVPDRITRKTYDAAGHLTRVERGVGSNVQVDYLRAVYSPNGKQTAVIDARGNRTTLTYDGFDRLWKRIFPAPDLPAAGAIGASNAADYEEYGYDPAGNRVSFRRRGGRSVTYEYDALNQVRVKRLPVDAPAAVGSADVYYAYDLLGRMLYARFGSDAGAGTTRTYDAAGRLRSDTTFGLTVAAEPDEAGARAATTLPGGLKILHEYDAAGRLLRLREDGQTTGAGVLATFQYDALGRRDLMVRGNGGYADYVYDGAGRLRSLEQKAGGQAGSLQTMTFNPASQLAELTQANALYVWTARPVDRGERAYDGLNRDAAIVARDGGYDGNGNLADDGVRTFKYDVENRLVALRPPLSGSGSAMDLAYDPLGRLASFTVGPGTASAVTTRFVYDGERLVAEYAADGSLLRRYVHGPGVDEALVWYEGNSRRWLHSDRLGSIIAWSDQSGQVTPYTYGPWGEPSDWGPMRFRYTGQVMLQEAQLYHYKARVYDPLAGRFLQTDPIGDEDDLNLYAYVASDPVNLTDPTGEKAFGVCRRILSGGGNHCFTYVTNDDGSLRKQFSYGPQSNDPMKPGQLVNTLDDPDSDTTKGDNDARTKGKNVSKIVDLNEFLGATDDEIIKGYERTDKKVGTTKRPGPTRYEAWPTGRKGRANSNAGFADGMENVKKGSSDEFEMPKGGFTPGMPAHDEVGKAPPPPPKCLIWVPGCP